MTYFQCSPSVWPLCFLNSKHQCTEDDVENDNQDSKQESTYGPEEDILDYQACHTHGDAFNGIFSPHDKHQI